MKNGSVAAIQSQTVVLVKKEVSKEFINDVEHYYYHLTFSDGENLYSCLGDETCYSLQVLQEYDAAELKRVRFCRDILYSIVKSLNSDITAYKDEISDIEEQLSDVVDVRFNRELAEHKLNNRNILLAAYEEIVELLDNDELGLKKYRVREKE